jgi:phenylpropionate dioxygenase-like ring-hydroxylating dioxygenase large terminal subunit
MPQVTTYRAFDRGPDARCIRRASLDAARYTSRDFMDREWDGVWTRSWLLAGLECDVREAGEFFVFNIARESVLVTRTEEGDIAAHYNVCQHRGNRLVTLQRGWMRQVACPYHGWTYGMDGGLRTVPDEARFGPGVPCGDFSLKPVKVDTWAGLVWINMDPEARPLADFLGAIPAELAPYRLHDMLLATDQTVRLDANWKTCIDNFSEQYHVDFIHPQHASYVDCANGVNDLWPYGHRRVHVQGYVTNPRYGTPEEVPPVLAAAIRPLGLDPADFRGRVGDLREAVQQQKRKVGPELGMDYAQFSDGQVSDIVQYDLFPNVIMTVKPESLMVLRPRPHPTDPDKCFFDRWTLRIPTTPEAARALRLGGDPNAAPDAVVERPEREEFGHEEIIAGRRSLSLVVDQDIQHLPHMQAGLHSRGFSRAVLNEDECRVQHFHDWLDVWLEGSPLAGAR